MIITFEDILKEIGGFGRFQFKAIFLICIPVLFLAANAVSYIFISRKPAYRCYVNECDDFNETSSYNQNWLRDVLPGSVSNGKFTPDECYRFSVLQNITDTVNATCTPNYFSHEKERCNKWVFSNEEVTMVNSWPDELTCDENQWKLAFLGTSTFAGVMAGSMIFGIISDYFGRRITFIISILFMAFCGIGQAFSTSYPMLVVFTALNAGGTCGVYFTAFVLILEMIDKDKRGMSTVLLDIVYSFGEIMAGFIAFYDRNWRNFVLWISVPPIAFGFGYWIIPESMCWLLSNKLYSSAYELAKKVAKDNKRELSSYTIAQFEGTNMNESSDSSSQSNDPSKTPSCKYTDLLKSRIMLVRVLVLCVVWGTNTLVFYGLSLNSVNLSGHPHLNFILACLIEIPGTTMSWFLMNKIGRRHAMILSFLICGTSSISGAFLSEKVIWLQIVTFLISKMMIASTFSIGSVYTAEMMPTNLRSGCVGTFSTIGRFTSLFAPFVPLLRQFYSFLPMFVFGAFALAAGISTFLLPETLGCDLPDTISEAEEIGSKSSMLNCEEGVKDK